MIVVLCMYCVYVAAFFRIMIMGPIAICSMSQVLSRGVWGYAPLGKILSFRLCQVIFLGGHVRPFKVYSNWHTFLGWKNPLFNRTLPIYAWSLDMSLYQRLHIVCSKQGCQLGQGSGVLRRCLNRGLL